MRLATRSTVIAAALTAVAIASPVASARPAPSGPGTALAVTAIGAPTAPARLDLGTQQQSSGPHTQTVPVAAPTLPPAKTALAAAIERAKLQALENHVPPIGRTSNADTNAYATVTHPNPATPSGSGGFDWSDANPATPSNGKPRSTHTRRAAATIISAAVALTVLTAPATAEPPEHFPRPPADQRPTTAPAMRPSTPSDAPRRAYGSDLERLYLTFVGAFTAATLIGFSTATVAKHRKRRSPAVSAQADRNLRPR